MGKLLVAGDSFGEFSHYRNHHTTSKYIRRMDGDNWEIEFSHWCEQLADDVGLTAVTHAVGGAAISPSSFIAFQQLLSNEDYKGVVYFVSYQGRTLAQRALSVEEWREYEMPHILFNRGTPDQIYDPETLQLYKHYKYHYHRSVKDSTINKPQLQHLNTEEIADQKLLEELAASKTNEVYSNDITYLTHKPSYSYTHDSITAIIALQSLCKQKNIPLVLASSFTGGICEAIQNMGLEIKFFNFPALEFEYNFYARDGYPSHYSQEEHDIIYNEFKKQYPEYKEMFSSNS